MVLIFGSTLLTLFILFLLSTVATRLLLLLLVPFPAGFTLFAQSNAPSPASRCFRVLTAPGVLRLRVLGPEALNFSKILLDAALALLVGHSMRGLLAGSSLIVSVLLLGASPARPPWILEVVELGPLYF